MKYKKIKNVKIELPIKRGAGNTKKALGYQYFEEPYANIFLCARKKSGKTTLIYNIIKNTVSPKQTFIYLFVSTFYNDETYRSIEEYMVKHNFKYKVFTSMYSYEYGTKINLLESTIKEIDFKAKNATTNTFTNKNAAFQCIILDDDYTPKQKKKKESKFVAPQFLFVFDDISNELRYNTALDNLIKKNRHLKSKIVLSSQSYKDLTPSIRANLDYLILFKNLPDEVLKDIYTELQFKDLSFDEFKNIYTEITDQPYHFMYIYTKDMEIRDNFDKQLVPE